ncbi:MAG: DMT family transporter [Bacillota bacterium]|nr:DMT family transporter [Bacillota bacterium]
MNRYLPYLAGIGVALTWGFSFMFTRSALDQLSPFHLLGLRFAAAAGAMLLLRLFKIITIDIIPADYISLLPLAVFQPILYFSAETAGVMLTSASYSGMMIAAIPIFVAIFSAFILREYPSKLQVFFIIASVSGVVFIVFMDNQSITGVNPLGTLALLGAVMAAACYNISSRKASVYYNPLQLTWVMMVVGAIVFNAVSLVQHIMDGRINQFLTPLADQWLTIIYLGVASSVAAFFMYNFMLSKIAATRGSVFANMVTVVAIAAGVIFRGETVYWYHLIGTAAILAGVWGTNRFSPQVEKYLGQSDN